MGEPQKHVKWKKPDQKRSHIIWLHLYEMSKIGKCTAHWMVNCMLCEFHFNILKCQKKREIKERNKGKKEGGGREKETAHRCQRKKYP